MTEQHVLKKHIAAIHVSNNISLLQRKISNVLLLNAAPDLKDKEEFQIGLSVLAERAGFDSKNLSYLKEALLGLATTAIKWNLTDESGEEEWGVASILAEAKILKRSGICKYAYPTTLRHMLSDPKVFASIDIRVQQRFSSAYALALYENCLRYVQVGRTGEWPLSLFKDLMGVPEGGLYEDFRFLNRNIIKRAVTEVNDVSTIEVEPIFHKQGRRVAAIQFKVREKRQEGLQLEAPLFSTSLLNRFVDEFELTENQAKHLLSLHSEEYLIGNMEVVAARIRAGKVKEIGPYTLKAMREDFRTKPSALKTQLKQEKAVQEAKRKQQLAEQSKLRLDTETARTWLEGLDEVAYQALVAEYRMVKKAPLIKKKLEEVGMDHPIVQADFVQFVARSRLAAQKQS